MSKIRVVGSDRMKFYASAVAISLTTGQTLSGYRAVAIGEPEDPLPANAVVDKFLRLSIPTIGYAQADEIRRSIERLEMSNARDIVRLMHPFDRADRSTR